MIIYNKIIPFPGFTAINLCGIIFARNEFNPLPKSTINHERIHTRQLIETLFIWFYLIYIVNFLILFLKTWKWKEAYRNIAFEKEAYYFQFHEFYLTRRPLFHWIKFF